MPQPPGYAAQLPPSHQGTLIPHPMHLQPQAPYHQLPPPQMLQGMMAVSPQAMYPVQPPAWQYPTYQPYPGPVPYPVPDAPYDLPHQYAPGWHTLSQMPGAVPSMYNPVEEVVPVGVDEWLLLEQEEAAGRGTVWDEEATALKVCGIFAYTTVMPG